MEPLVPVIEYILLIGAPLLTAYVIYAVRRNARQDEENDRNLLIRELSTGLFWSSDCSVTLHASNAKRYTRREFLRWSETITDIEAVPVSEHQETLAHA